jgi:pimeloyl-ACP methyl ester carboxylesterase
MQMQVPTRGCRRPRPESVLTSAELAAITTPAIFILGSDDPYLSIERARPSIDLIHGARLYEVPGGHAPGSSTPGTRPS